VTARRLIVGLVALLLAAVIVRNSAVDALAERDPTAASRIWSTHPAVRIAAGMTAIATAARARQAAPDDAVQQVANAAIKAPLASEPFLVKGVQAQLAGQSQTAEQAFVAAERRNPRSLPAHYFLAEHYFRARDATRGFNEIAALARMAPNGVGGIAPYIAAYARDRANWPRLRAMFRANPEIEEAALVALATDAANADTIVALVPENRRSGRSPWLPVLLNSLVTAGDFAKARATWATMSGVRTGPDLLVFNPEFAKLTAPPPFNWEFTSSAVGLAEGQPGGRLHAIFYGQESGVLVRQLLLLRPGAYRLSMRLIGDRSQGKALSWSLRCAKQQNALAAVPVDVAATSGWRFAISGDCAAQWLELSGTSSDVTQQADIVIAGLELRREVEGG